MLFVGGGGSYWCNLTSLIVGLEIFCAAKGEDNSTHVSKNHTKGGYGGRRGNICILNLGMGDSIDANIRYSENYDGKYVPMLGLES
jgi:hypothetical protein